MAQAMGIPVPWVHTAVFAIGAGMAAASGVLFGPLVGVNHAMGLDWVLKAFIVVVVGGMGNLGGSIAGLHLHQPARGLRGDLRQPGPGHHRLLRRADPHPAVPAHRPVRADAQMTKRPQHRPTGSPSAIVIALLIVAPLVLPEFWRRFLTEILIWGLLAMSSDILIGYTGMVSFGHSAFFGLGMYGAAAALLMVKPPNLWLAILYGLAGSAAIAAVRRLLLHPPARHLFRHHHADLLADLLRHHLHLDRGDGRRERPLRSAGPSSASPACGPRPVHLRDAALVRAGGGGGLLSHRAAHHPVAVRHGAAVDPRERGRARAPSAIRSSATRWWP